MLSALAKVLSSELQFGGTRLFGRSKEARTDDRLVSETVEGLTMFGMPHSQARTMAQELLRTCKRKIADAGGRRTMYDTGGGDGLLSFESRDETIRKFLEVRRSHGATNEDVRRWHNLCELERVMLLEQDQWMLVATFRAVKDQGQPDEQAAKTATKAHARYTAQAEKIGTDGHKDLLPAELKLRVNEYRDRLIAQNPSRLKQEVDEAGDFNALVRAKLATGEL